MTKQSCTPAAPAIAAAGQFGGAWYKQKADFSLFPGAVLATTNCVMDPPKAYKDNIFTVNAVSDRINQSINQNTKPAMPKGSLRTKQHTTPADEQKSCTTDQVIVC